MTTILFQILLISVGSVWFAEHGIIPKVRFWLYRTRRIKHPYSRIKPFDCPLCLAWWTGLIWFFSHPLTPEHAIAAPVFAAFTSLLAVWISKQASR